MKKLYVLIAMIGLSSFVLGQTFLAEDFSSNQMPPDGWTIDAQAAQWSVSNSNNALGIAPEAKFSYTNGNATSRLISPAIDLTGYSSVFISFNHFLDDYSGSGYSIGCATTSGGTGVWNTVWEVSPTGNVGPETLTFEINNSDVGQPDFQFCFYFDGNMYNLDYWYIDDILLYIPVDLDAQMVSINTPSYVGGSVDVSGTFKNFGTTDITSIDINWEVNGEVTMTSITGLSVPFGETYDFTLNGQFDYPIGSYDLTVSITLVNGVVDDDPANNDLTKQINVVSHTVDKRPCYEEFTSSTCGPCAGFNTQFVPWCETHADEITLVKYQMNWPGSGDPYYTAEGGVRRDYYGVTWVPWLEAEGEFCETSVSAAQAVLDEAATKPGLMSIAASHSLDGTVMTIDATVLPYANFSEFRVFIVVFENETTQNIGSNGETSFQHVMMKMVPDANGTQVDLTDREPITISESVDLSGTNVEEWDDLGVAIICQNYSSKAIFQSDYSVENAAYATEARLSSILVDGEEIADFDPDTYSYDVALAPGTVEVPVVEAVLMDANGTKIIVPANEIPGTTTIDTYGEDLATHLTYNVNFSIGTGIGDEAFEAVKVYPNPTNGTLYFKGIEGANVKVYSVTGSLVADVKDFSTNSINLSNLPQGVYYVSIILDDKTVVTKKISLLK